MTSNLLAIKLVPRHSYNSESLYLDWQKPRRASLLPASDRTCPELGSYSTASTRSATLTNSTGGPLCASISHDSGTQPFYDIRNQSLK